MQYYSYLWLREDSSPYYAGKGCGKRAYRSLHHNVNCPADIARILVFLHPTEADAFESEIAFIKWFGRKDIGTGCLRNITNGGEGQAGRICSPATRMRISAKLKDRVLSSKTKEKMSAARLGLKQSSETIAKRSATQRAQKRTISPENQAKMAAGRVGHMHHGYEVMKRIWDTRFLKTVAWG